MKYTILIISLIFLFSCTSKIEIRRCIDGDTIVSTTGERVRLSDIDASELHQFYGIQAKNYLKSLIEGKTVEIRRKGKDKYKRTLAELYYKDIWINKQMVVTGNAWAYKRYSSLYNEEIKARKLRLGLWAYSSEPPYIFRRNEK